jgi:hypothetical protein
MADWFVEALTHHPEMADMDCGGEEEDGKEAREKSGQDGKTEGEEDRLNRRKNGLRRRPSRRGGRAEHGFSHEQRE